MPTECEIEIPISSAAKTPEGFLACLIDGDVEPLYFYTVAPYGSQRYFDLQCVDFNSIAKRYFDLEPAYLQLTGKSRKDLSRQEVLSLYASLASKEQAISNRIVCDALSPFVGKVARFTRSEFLVQVAGSVRYCLGQCLLSSLRLLLYDARLQEMKGSYRVLNLVVTKGLKIYQIPFGRLVFDLEAVRGCNSLADLHRRFPGEIRLVSQRNFSLSNVGDLSFVFPRLKQQCFRYVRDNLAFGRDGLGFKKTKKFASLAGYGLNLDFCARNLATVLLQYLRKHKDFGCLVEPTLQSFGWESDFQSLLFISKNRHFLEDGRPLAPSMIGLLHVLSNCRDLNPDNSPLPKEVDAHQAVRALLFKNGISRRFVKLLFNQSAGVIKFISGFLIKTTKHDALFSHQDFKVGREILSRFSSSCQKLDPSISYPLTLWHVLARINWSRLNPSLGARRPSVLNDNSLTLALLIARQALVDRKFKRLKANPFWLKNAILPGLIDYLAQTEFFGNQNGGLPTPLPASMPLQTLLTRSDLWHLQMQELDRERRDAEFQLSWSPRFADFENEDYLVRELTCARALYEEGAALHHCVYSYRDSCARGEVSVFSVRSKRNPKIRSTLSVYGSRICPEIDQHRSHCNERPTAGELSLAKSLPLFWKQSIKKVSITGDIHERAALKSA